MVFKIPVINEVEERYSTQFFKSYVQTLGYQDLTIRIKQGLVDTKYQPLTNAVC